MIINIITDDHDGWVYSRFISHLKQYSNHQIVVNQDQSIGDVLYYMPYYLVNVNATKKPSCCWLSHQEQSNPLKAKFIKSAGMVNIGISHSKKYADILVSNGMRNIVQIVPGVDADHFTLSPANRKPNKKLVVAYFGRPYGSSNRKNPPALKKISKLPWVDFRPTNGKVKWEDLPKWYHEADVVVSPSHYEAGPLSLQESLACGVPFMCLAGVGMAQEFNFGVIKAKNIDDMIVKLKKMHGTEQWKDLETMKKMRESSIIHTIEKFVKEHDKIWERLYDK